MKITSAPISSLLNIIIPAPKNEFLLLLQENITNPLSWSLLLKSDVTRVTHRIRKYVLNGDTNEAWTLKSSYKDTFSLEAVSATIIAQIAITMLGLANFGNIHWTATAFAYTSMVSGILSAFFSFYVQQTLSDLHSPEDVRKWLISPRNNLSTRLIKAIPYQYRSQRTGKDVANDNNGVPSLTAAAALTAPSRLLNVSILSLFIALGIYLGCVYTAELGTLKGSNANLAVLIVFIIVSALAFSELYIPLQNKDIDQLTASLERKEEWLQSSSNSRHNIGLIATGETSDTRDILRDALKASIRAQEESLKAQKAILELLDSQFSECNLALRTREPGNLVTHSV
ncbi:hypothetical protein ASPBRDRAFT_640027 [Aspergillus brasiliensis CBS 101740]|uniref:Uncharacterized protein n=1 Tax=Aspergillus brasiliensis (strain CBS 101740 / IMI 381727 / IBT 21946) TaxID=767769 RepID=A0A1L9UDP5_ASPBC|nr:hypothetical protein ASPBRDRAFT_640027 [Aspergillus brasiliensis CBS 101740]